VYVNAADGSGAVLIDVETGRAVQSLAPFTLDPEAAPTADLDRQVIFHTTVEGSLVRRDLVNGAVMRDSSAEPPLNRFGAGSRTPATGV
jgi:hypothetical protein